MNLLKSFLTGLAAAAIIFGTVEIIGFNSYTWSMILYMYIVLAVFVSMESRYDSGLKEIVNHLGNIRSRMLFVIDEEERKVKRVFTGEEFKIKDSEKVQ
ncbi:MAG: hypothetical protein R6V35_00050 [Candidatus Nanohaloarchaea archaeon]